ncbi:kinase-like domain-containing protein [Diaporthe sp. PMI_573]|nr:kinase-like domain-containing protein [Diaporthaceae sp. PMI_573]
MKLRKGVQVHHDVLPGTEILPTNTSVHNYLDQSLRRALRECDGDEGKYFMPNDDLDRIICHDTIRRYLSSMVQPRILNQIEQITTYVCGDRERAEELHTGKRVFASLILANKADAVTLLYDEVIRDEDLPLMKTDIVGSTFNLKRKNSQTSILGCFSDWNHGEIELFDKHQREMKPPFFAQDIDSQPLHYELSRGSCLPWIKYGENIHLSSNSEVRRVEIHPAQHDLPPKGNNLFALKTLKSKKFEEFNLEVKALKKILPHSNLVTLLATFYYKEEYHLLFPWAEGGNLLELWRTHHPEPSIDIGWMRWLAEQCCGLAEGLNGIHDAKMPTSELAVPSNLKKSHTGNNHDDKDCGVHGDIKPQNILWFTQEHNLHGHGVLKISDFGVTMFHSELTTKVLPDKVRGITQSYAAPEHQLGTEVSRPYDIWSLGCIFIEFITWALEGFDGVQKFRDKRKEDRDTNSNFELDDFYRISKKKTRMFKWCRKERAVVKASVHEWIDHLLKRPACSPYLAEFLSYIKDHMILVVTSARHKCDQVNDKLRSMLQHCEQSSEYCLSSSLTD